MPLNDHDCNNNNNNNNRTESNKIKYDKTQSFFLIRERFLDRELQIVILKMTPISPSCTLLSPSYVNRECVPLILTNILYV